ncbi:MAG: molybdopterin-guanine dinucleotide biosynthesis protein B [Magnetospirillum sp.]|nr:molybdopterin-guanine dinucleotide biosynthesis protein B [Magnetospirillum sp.]
MRIFGLAGWSGSGKTTLVTALLPRLTAGGLRVSTLKHSHHDVEVDRPGKDSHRHREAGATEVIVASTVRWALIRERRDAPEPTLDDLIARLAPVDLVLVEGFKSAPHPKLEVHRPSLGKAPLWPGDPAIVAVASDVALGDIGRPVFSLDDPAAIAAFILAETGFVR